MGPLPTIDRADELKRQSVARIGAAIPKNRFLQRDEPQDDKGVDLAFEAIIANRATRFTAIVQVKGTDSTELNVDHSFSFSIKTSNLNYLLNGSCPLYIVWFARRDELRYVWARDEAKRLHRDNPTWTEQETVVLRFSKLLDEAGWDDIHDRIVREGRFNRTQHDFFTKAGTVECVAVGVNPETLDVVTPDQAFDAVKNHGIAIVSSGYPLAIKHFARFLTPQQATDPGVLLALGFACHHLGEHFEARGHLGRVIPQRAKLSEFDRYVLDSLVNECNLRFGVLDEEGFRVAQSVVEKNAPPFLALQMRLERLRWAHLAEHDNPKRRVLLEELRTAVTQIESDSGSSVSMKLQAALIRLFAEVADSNTAVMEAVITMAARARMRQNPFTSNTRGAWDEATAAQDQAHRDAQELLDRALELKHPVLIAEAILTQCVYRIGTLTQNAIAIRLISGKVKPIPHVLVTAISQQLEQAVAQFQRAGATESVVRATLILAEWYATNDAPEKARGLAEGIMGLAQGMGYTHYVEQGQAILSGTTQFDRLRADIATRPDSDFLAVAQTDEQVADFALFNLQTVELPMEQLPVVHRVCLVMREESRTRIEWCKHFRHFVDGPHAEILPTSYATDPNWFARCMRFGFHTYTPSTDAGAITQRFKNTYCNTCTDRCPKRGDSQT